MATPDTSSAPLLQPVADALTRCATPPEEVGGAVVFLASDLLSYVTGETIHVDGGTFASSGWFHRPEGGGYGYGP